MRKFKFNYFWNSYIDLMYRPFTNFLKTAAILAVMLLAAPVAGQQHAGGGIVLSDELNQQLDFMLGKGQLLMAMDRPSEEELAERLEWLADVRKKRDAGTLTVEEVMAIKEVFDIIFVGAITYWECNIGMDKEACAAIKNDELKAYKKGLEDEESAKEEMSAEELETMLMSMSLDDSYYQMESGLIPEILWKSGLLNPYAAGFVDGLWETIDGTWGIVKFMKAWQAPYGGSAEDWEIRIQTYKFIEFLNELAQSEELRTQAWNNVKQSFSEYVSETAGLDNQAMYNQGKLLFDVVTLFIGVGEVKAILKGKQVTIGIVALIQAVPKNLSKFVFKVREFGLAVVKSGNKILIKDGTVEIASIADNVLIPKVFLDGGQEVLTEAGEVLAKNTEGSYGFKIALNFWKKKIEYKGIRVFQRNDLFDPSIVSSWREKGKTFTGTNIERMASGRSPIGTDGKPVNLHHLIQNETGGLAEVLASFHQKYSTTLHINPNTIPSGINRADFDLFRSEYWISRASEFK